MSNSTMDPVEVCKIQQRLVVDFQSTTRNIIALFPLIYAIPSLLLHIRITILLIRKRKMAEFSSDFYRLFIVESVVALSYWCTYYYAYRLNLSSLASFLYEWMPIFGVGNVLPIFLASYFMYVDILISVVISFNRLIAIVFPFYYDKIWKKLSHLFNIFLFLTPIIFTWAIFFYPIAACRISNINNTGEHYVITNPVGPFIGINLNLGSVIVGVFSSVLSFIMNMIIIWYLATRRKNMKKNNTTNGFNTSTSEIKFMAITILIFINTLIFGLLQLAIYLGRNGYVQILSQYYDAIFSSRHYFVDLICLSPPWFLLLTSTDVRRNILFWKKNNDNTLFVTTVKSLTRTT